MTYNSSRAKPLAGKRAIIAGAGPGGLAAALALRQAGLEVTVCESGDSLAGGSALTLWPNAMHALDFLGLRDEIAAVGVPLGQIVVRRSCGSLIFADDLIAVTRDRRFTGVVLLRTDLVNALARRFGGSLLFNAAVADFHAQNDGISVRLADDRTLDCDMLIGADGLHSAVRRNLLAEDRLIYAGYALWRGIAEANFAGDTGTMWMGPGQQFGCFPLPLGRTYWFASEATSEDSAVTAESIAELCRSFAVWDPIIASIISATPKASFLRHHIYDRPTQRRWSFERVTLLGDAAHPAVPTMGQGACQAIEDAVVLGRCCIEQNDVCLALAEYQNRRIMRANSFVSEARRMSVMGQWRNPLVIYVRDSLMRMVPRKLRRAQLARAFEFVT